MRISLVILLLVITCTGFSQTPKKNESPQKFILLECTGDKLTVGTRNNLENEIKSADSVHELERKLKQWTLSNKLYDIKATIQELRTSGETYVWLQSTRFGSELTKITGVRGSGDLTTSEILSCIFNDTLVVIDTLKLQLTVRASEQFILRVGTSNYPIPRINNSGFLFSPSLFSGLPTEAYIDATIVQQSGSLPTVSRKIKLYIFSINERNGFAQSIKHWFGDGNADCDLLIGSISNYIEKVKGSNQCNLVNTYKLALNNSVRRLVKRLEVNCK